MLPKRYLNPKLNKRKIQNEVEDQEEDDEKRSRLKRTRRRLHSLIVWWKRVKKKIIHQVIVVILQVYPMVLMMIGMILKIQTQMMMTLMILKVSFLQQPNKKTPINQIQFFPT